MWERIKNEWPLVFIGIPILLFIGTYCITTDDMDGNSGKIIGGIAYAIAVFGFLFGVVKK